MQSLAKLITLGAMLLCVGACSGIDHNIPQHTPISQATPPGTITLYADANGYLYPDNWHHDFRRRAIERNHSLLASKDFEPQVRDALAAERERQLAAAADALADRSRIFVLVHGFNNTHQEARTAFTRLRELLPVGSNDGVVEFHWDGLASAGRIGTGLMWFNAVGYSQLAGTQALRGLIRRLHHKEIVLVAHSRGASVVLSALSDPAFDPDFKAATEALQGVALYSGPVPAGGAAIRAIFLAPAIGYPDFWAPGGARGSECRNFRAFPDRLKRIDYTVNPQDPVLDKPLVSASTFNATDLGYDPAVGRQIGHCYDGKIEVVGHSLEMPRHSFLDYLGEGVVRQMLAGADARLRR